MSPLIDSSVLIAAMVLDEPHHEESRDLLDQGGYCLYAHAILETFNTLTGGRRPYRLRASLAVKLLEEDFLPSLSIISLKPTEIARALGSAESRGVRGGAVFDYMHLVAARKAKAPRLYTLNFPHFQAFRREGDPEIVQPGE